MEYAVRKLYWGNGTLKEEYGVSWTAKLESLWKRTVRVTFKKHGEYKEWNEEGHLITHCVYDNDVLHGKYKRWDADKKLQVHRVYRHGKVVEEQYF